MEPSPLRVIVAEREDPQGDSPALAGCLERAGIEVVAVATDAHQAIEAARGLSPDLALIDVGLSGGGVSATRVIVGSVGDCRVVALSTHDQRGTILPMLLAGAVGYIVRGTPEDEIATIVRRAAGSEAELSVDAMTGLMIDLLREISDRTESEARLRRSEERFRALLEAAPDAVVIANEDGEIVLVNGQTEMLFGYERRILLGKRIEFLLPERYHLGHAEHRMRYASAPRPRRMGTVPGLVGRRMDGREFPVDVSLSTLDTDEGVLVIAFVRNANVREGAGAMPGHVEATPTWPTTSKTGQEDGLSSRRGPYRT